MKAFLVAVSSLCLCGILLCFMAYATGKFPSIPRVYDMPKLTQHTSVATMPQQVENYQGRYWNAIHYGGNRSLVSTHTPTVCGQGVC